MPQLSPFHPSLRKYSAKRPVRHHRFRQCCLSEIFDSYFCWLLISPPPPPLYRLFYFFCLGAGTCPRDGILLHIPFSLLSRERGGRGLQGRNSLCSPPPASRPSVRPPPIFPFQPWSNYMGFGVLSSALFHMAQIPRAIKNIFLLKRKRKPREQEACSISSPVH